MSDVPLRYDCGGDSCYDRTDIVKGKVFNRLVFEGVSQHDADDVKASHEMAVEKPFQPGADRDGLMENYARKLRVLKIGAKEAANQYLQS